ncbi:MAG: hypothetical protein ABUL42_04265 [Terricaulis silvestris]
MRSYENGLFNMAGPSFSAGQRVSVVRPQKPLAVGATYKVVGALPAEGQPVRYRVKSEGEPFERIIDASRLEALDL